MDLNRNNMKKIALLIAFAVLLFVGLENFQKVTGVISGFFALVSPFILGGCIAFILNVPIAFIERSLFGKRREDWARKCKRPVSLVLAIALVLGLVVVVVLLVAPQIARSIGLLSNRMPDFFLKVQGWISELEAQFPALSGQLSNLQFDWDTIDWGMVGQTAWDFLRNGAGDMLGSTFNMASSIIGAIVNFFLGMFFALYVLLQKEKLGRQVKKLLYAVLPSPKADGFLSICTLSQQTFANFITGQCTEAVILGLMFFISMSVLHFPYALLVGALIALTALIPIFGAFIGCFVGAFLILIENPMQALWFIILFLVLQQVEGNLIYPHVVGNSVGLPSLWVLVAVTVGGSTMGIVGMIICIPVFSVLYTLIRTATNNRLRARGVPPEKWGDSPQKPPKGKTGAKETSAKE
ncbi:AI-2E family transporter [Intestinibacillus massiliensis]|nr:AI-2E family transporter [Intestinibacillus massiliensis]